ncbi:uncharacterized protein CDAR_205801 [Caerostris darwini]|uniref:Uncharacterized protein n=1 Tax=Caerostris darwini TaxID=1538125 RepID=A0AAV4QXQ7_9ARAC|nr:uncharacterized protein CDAR_205801 [Caerostris darwini]
MSSGDEQSDEEAVPLFRPFTKESLASIEARIAEASARKAERERLKAEGEIGPDGIPEHYSIPHHEERLEPDPALEVGMPLPRALAPNFPPELIATPIEDLDKYYENERYHATAPRILDDLLWVVLPWQLLHPENENDPNSDRPMD